MDTMNKLLLLISCIILTACEKDNEQPEPTAASAKIWFGGYRDQLMDPPLSQPLHTRFYLFDANDGQVYDKEWLEENCYDGLPSLTSIVWIHGILTNHPTACPPPLYHIIPPVEIDGKEFLTLFPDARDNDYFSADNDFAAEIPFGKYYVFAIPMQHISGVVSVRYLEVKPGMTSDEKVVVVAFTDEMYGTDYADCKLPDSFEGTSIRHARNG